MLDGAATLQIPMRKARRTANAIGQARLFAAALARPIRLRLSGAWYKMTTRRNHPRRRGEPLLIRAVQNQRSSQRAARARRTIRAAMRFDVAGIEERAGRRPGRQGPCRAHRNHRVKSSAATTRAVQKWRASKSIAEMPRVAKRFVAATQRARAARATRPRQGVPYRSMMLTVDVASAACTRVPSNATSMASPTV